VEVHTEFWWGDLKQIYNPEYPEENGIIILNVFKKVEGIIDWMYLADDTDIWRAFVNTVMNVLVP
jgi:hypothetical protein